ncbi:MAG: DsbC family protein [Hydrogenophaga sp.]|nr:DsbC family protein [Hydrogenophaga sp.]
MKAFLRTALSLTLALAGLAAHAQEATIRKNLGELLSNPIRIEEISKTPMEGLYEVRYNGNEIFYTDANGSFILDGQLLDLKAKTNLTEQRIDKLTAIEFKDLPLKDSFTVVRGNGKRKVAVFEDPNCGYCKRFERDLAKVDNVTVHVFLYPILSQDSAEKSRAIWCAKDKGKTFMDWMTRDVPPPEATCDVAALARNVEFGKKNRITGTPTMIFTNGKKVPGAIPVDRFEKLLAEASK